MGKIIADIRLFHSTVENKDGNTLPSNYGNKSLNEDSEYQFYKDKKANLTRTFIIYGLIAGSIFAVSLTFAIKAAIKRAKNVDGDTNTTTLTNNTITPEKPKTKYCAYCGVALESGENKCKVCGARNDK